MADHQIHSPTFNQYDIKNPHYTITIIEAKFKNSTQLDTDGNYILKVRSAFIDKNPNLKYYLMLINKDSLHNSAVLLIISINYDNKVCIPKDFTIGSSEVISNDSYSIIEIFLTARCNDLKTDAQTFLTQKIHAISTHSDHSRQNTNQDYDSLR